MQDNKLPEKEIIKLFKLTIVEQQQYEYIKPIKHILVEYDGYKESYYRVWSNDLKIKINFFEFDLLSQYYDILSKFINYSPEKKDEIINLNQLNIEENSIQQKDSLFSDFQNRNSEEYLKLMECNENDLMNEKKVQDNPLKRKFNEINDDYVKIQKQLDITHQMFHKFQEVINTQSKQLDLQNKQLECLTDDVIFLNKKVKQQNNEIENLKDTLKELNENTFVENSKVHYDSHKNIQSAINKNNEKINQIYQTGLDNSTNIELLETIMVKTETKLNEIALHMLNEDKNPYFDIYEKYSSKLQALNTWVTEVVNLNNLKYPRKNLVTRKFDFNDKNDDQTTSQSQFNTPTRFINLVSDEEEDVFININ